VGENLELVRGLYRDWERGDFSSVDWAHPEIELVPHTPLLKPARGITELGERWRDWLSSFSEWRLDLEELLEVGDEVVALTRIDTRGKGSGIRFDSIASANVFAFRDGKVVRLELHLDRGPVLERFGIEREASAE
jgi:hypothetical protein